MVEDIYIFFKVGNFPLCQQNGVSIMVQVALGPDASGERVHFLYFFICDCSKLLPLPCAFSQNNGVYSFYFEIKTVLLRTP